MGNKKITKEDEIEKTIRALLKLPENKRCINCNLLGPQYVCTTFLTFVCTTCSGIHREFTHRVKSVSMAKFSEEEVTALQAAGNERAREIYFKTWDPQRYPLPDNSNLHKLRDFIKHVYVDRKFTGERSDRLPNVRLGHSEDSYESRKVSVFSGGSKSPLYEGRQERSPNGVSSPSGTNDAVRGYYSERRSPRYAQENSRLGGLLRNPMCIEIVDSRLRDDDPRSARKQDKQSFSPREPVTRSKSSDHRKNVDSSSGSPVVRSLKDIWGEENGSTLQVGHPKASAARDPEGSAKSQKTASSGGMESLIDFSMDSEPSDVVAAPKTQQVPPSSDGGNQSSDDLSLNEKAAPALGANSLELLLFDLSAPSGVSIHNVSPVQGTADVPSTASGQNISLDSFSWEEPSAQLWASTSTVGSPTVPPAINVQQKPSNVYPLQTRTNSKLQPGPSSQVHDTQQPSNVSTEQLSQPTSKSAEKSSSEVGAQPLSAETKPSGRKELPEDLFSTSYALAPAAVQGWQSGQQQGAGFGLQYYPNSMHAAAFRITVKANPFDLNSETTPAQAPSFPSMASLAGALPIVQAPTGSLHTSGTEAHSSGTESHPSYLASLMTSNSHFPSAVPSSAYMGNRSHISVPPSRPGGISDFGSEVISGSISTNQRPAEGHSASNSPNSFRTMGSNPFG